MQDHDNYLNSISASKSPCTAAKGTRNLIPGSGKFQDPETGAAEWDKLETTAFQRIITSQHDFIRFMQSLHVPDEFIRFPPEDGWPEINKADLYRLYKSDKVFKVLRNMPYIKEDPDDMTPREILEGSALFDYRGPEFLEEVYSGELRGMLYAAEPPSGPAPQDTVGLVLGRSDACIMLDCRYGIVQWLDCGEGYTSFGLQTKRKPLDAHDMVSGCETAWPVEEFFEYIKAKLINLELLAFNQGRLISKDLSNVEPVYGFDTFKEMYQRHGWPGANYDKDACMKEMTEYCKESGIN